MWVILLPAVLLFAAPASAEPGFSEKYERDYNIFNPLNEYRPDNPLNPINTYDPKNPFNPINQYDPGNPANPINQYNPNNPFNPINQYNPKNPLNPINEYNPTTPFEPVQFAAWRSISLSREGVVLVMGASTRNEGEWSRRTTHRTRRNASIKPQ